MPELRAAAAAPILAALLTLGGPAGAAGEIPPAVDEKAYLEVATTILCDCGCHPQSVHACACGRAAEMRDEIATALIQGGPGGTAQSAAQVVDSYVARYGEKIRIAPTTTGFNLVAWLGPSIGLLLAGLAVAFALRRWRSRPIPQPAPVGAPDIAYLERLRRELQDER